MIRIIISSKTAGYDRRGSTSRATAAGRPVIYTCVRSFVENKMVRSRRGYIVVASERGRLGLAFSVARARPIFDFNESARKQSCKIQRALKQECQDGVPLRRRKRFETKQLSVRTDYFRAVSFCFLLPLFRWFRRQMTPPLSALRRQSWLTAVC